jgi:hypothetical protein
MCVNARHSPSHSHPHFLTRNRYLLWQCAARAGKSSREARALPLSPTNRPLQQTCRQRHKLLAKRALVKEGRQHVFWKGERAARANGSCGIEPRAGSAAPAETLK